MFFWSALHKREAHLSEEGFFATPLKKPGTPKKLFKLPLKRLCQKLSYPIFIKPRPRERFFDECEELAKPHFSNEFSHAPSGEGDGMYQMGQADQMVKTAHRLPVMRKEMFVTIATAFFGVITVLYPPPKARPRLQRSCTFCAVSG
jgi:hypothetical protein